MHPDTAAAAAPASPSTPAAAPPASLLPAAPTRGAAATCHLRGALARSPRDAAASRSTRGHARFLHSTERQEEEIARAAVQLAARDVARQRHAPRLGAACEGGRRDVGGSDLSTHGRCRCHRDDGAGGLSGVAVDSGGSGVGSDVRSGDVGGTGGVKGGATAEDWAVRRAWPQQLRVACHLPILWPQRRIRREVARGR